MTNVYAVLAALSCACGAQEDDASAKLSRTDLADKGLKGKITIKQTK